MILRLTFEELTTLNAAGTRLMGGPGDGSVLAPSEIMAELESRLPLEGDLSVQTLAEQGRLLGAVNTMLDDLKRRMDVFILEQYVGSEDAVNAYFDYANVLTARDRLAQMGFEMEELIGLITGGAPTSEDRRTVAFPD